MDPGRSPSIGDGDRPGLLRAHAGGTSAVRPAFAARVQSYCNAGDRFCQGGASLAPHLNYQGFRSQATQFVAAGPPRPRPGVDPDPGATQRPATRACPRRCPGAVTVAVTVAAPGPRGLGSLAGDELEELVVDLDPVLALGEPEKAFVPAERAERGQPVVVAAAVRLLHVDVEAWLRAGADAQGREHGRRDPVTHGRRVVAALLPQRVRRSATGFDLDEAVRLGVPGVAGVAEVDARDVVEILVRAGLTRDRRRPGQAGPHQPLHRVVDGDGAVIAPERADPTGATHVADL
ncbi:cutinase family protein [Micromonospora sp. KC207]|nr:cutinase family protein [Micromonospora sp. KC207]